jgi:hypothetical protein
MPSALVSPHLVMPSPRTLELLAALPFNVAFLRFLATACLAIPRVCKPRVPVPIAHRGSLAHRVGLTEYGSQGYRNARNEVANGRLGLIVVRHVAIRLGGEAHTMR